MSLGAANVTSVNSSATSATLLANNPGRRGCIIHNTDVNALLIKFGATASTSSFTHRITQNSSFSMPAGELYTGIIDGIWEADGAGAAKITEW